MKLSLTRQIRFAKSESGYETRPTTRAALARYSGEN
jgi:hypothetical protein